MRCGVVSDRQASRCRFALGGASPGAWLTVAYYAMVGGSVGALAAAVPGLIDLLSLKDAAIRKTALTHMGINLTVAALYAVNAWLRHGDPQGQRGPFWVSLLAILLLLASGWLGGKMVYLAGVAVSSPETPAC